MSERTRAGVKAAKSRGVKFGRKPMLSPLQIEDARKPIYGAESRKDVAALFKVGCKTLYRVLASRSGESDPVLPVRLIDENILYRQ